MIVLGISGSPRKGGNSDCLLDKALEGAKSRGATVEKIILNDLDFKPCQECGGCDKTGECVMQDDMALIYKKFDEVERIVIASPIFFGSLSAQVKMMIDRFNCRWIRKHVLKKKEPLLKLQAGIFLCVSGSTKEKFFNNAEDIIKNFFATLDMKYLGGLCFGGLDEKGAISGREEALKKSFQMGGKLVRS